jgi:excisionase family DNA binding protein
VRDLAGGSEQSGVEPMRSIQELSDWLDVPRKTIYKWTSDPDSGLPFYRIGRHLRFRFSEVVRWLMRYRASSGAREFFVALKQGSTAP